MLEQLTKVYGVHRVCSRRNLSAIFYSVHQVRIPLKKT